MYKIATPNSVLRIADNAYLSIDNYEYVLWISQGNTPLPMDALTPAQIAAAKQATQNILDTATAKADAKLSALAAMTPAQARAWVNANVNTLADAKDLLATQAVLDTILARRL